MPPSFTTRFFPLLLSASAFAQTMGTGTITGTVRDATSALVPDVRISAINGSTGAERTAVTNASGSFVIPAVQIGSYKISASHQGFKTVNQNDVRLSVDTVAAVNFTLEVGSTEQSVTVSAAVSALQTTSGEIGTTATGEQVSELSFNGRNFSQILTLGTGIASQNTGRRMGTGQEGNPLMSVNGGRINATKFTYDGIIAMDTGGNRGLNLFPPMEALAEVQIKTSNYTADSGSFGYGMVNVVTKSGGNAFHGELYEVNGIDAVAARNFFDNQRAPFKQNVFGFTIGGPIYTKNYNRDKSKTFFFVSEGWNKRQGPQLVNFTSPAQSTFTATTVDANQRQGIFATAVRDPANALPFAGNIVPASRIDPNATLILNRLYPLPNRAGNPNFVATPNSATRWREDMFRLDHAFVQNFLLTIRYAHDQWTQDQAIISPGGFAFPTGPGFFAKPGHNAVIRSTWTINPATVNVFTAGYSRNAITQVPNADAVSRKGLNIPEIFPGNFYSAVPIISLTGFGGVGVGGLTNNANNVYEYKDDLSHVAGSHSLKAGFDFSRLQKFVFGATNTEGTFAFNGQFSGNAVADLLLGRAFTYTENSLPPNGYFFGNTWEMYVQDDWKVSPNLTLNLGLRWGIYAGVPSGYEKYNNISGFSPSLYDPAKAPQTLPDGQLRAGTGDPLNGIFTPDNLKGLNLPRGLRTTRYRMPGPRLGFAWSPWGSTKTVIRGGYGIFYHWDNNNQTNLQTNVPFSTSANIATTLLSNPGGGTNRTFPPNVAAFNGIYKYPMVQQWSLTLQRELARQAVFSVAYVGNTAAHLDQTININQPAPSLAVANGSINVALVRPYQGYANINYNDRSASAYYHSMQTSLGRRWENGLTFQVSYTYAKSIARGVGQGAMLHIREKGLASLDQRHNMTFHYIYHLPFFRNSSGPVTWLFKGWESSGNATFSSGFPLTITQSGDRSGVGGGTQRPNVVGKPTVIGEVNNYFDTTAFALSPLGQFGNAGTGIVRGPGISNDVTMNFYRNFKFKMWGEGQRLRIGGEFFNIFNHANFSAVGTGFATATFGKITAALDPRQIQFSARLSF
ncbi:MAG: TonB-dependent receptor [Candidatus Solibacter usitatus]|nr:TonB-dependent receptor [Candidatus Solibacter usitatus]